MGLGRDVFSIRLIRDAVSGNLPPGRRGDAIDARFSAAVVCRGRAARVGMARVTVPPIKSNTVTCPASFRATLANRLLVLNTLPPCVREPRQSIVNLNESLREEAFTSVESVAMPFRQIRDDDAGPLVTPPQWSCFTLECAVAFSWYIRDEGDNGKLVLRRSIDTRTHRKLIFP